MAPQKRTLQEEISRPHTAELHETLLLQRSQPAGAVETPDILSPAEPDSTLAQEVEDLKKIDDWQQSAQKSVPIENKKAEVEYDFPITVNREVEYYLDFFQHRSRKSFKRWLARSGRYVPMISKELKSAGLPADLCYLPMIESGYALTAYSKARAVGPWQFMRATAIHFGLTVNNYVDERRDPVKSTKAAITYLKALHDEFNSWELAVAAYNVGEGRIRRAVKKYKTNNFWEIARHRYLPAETKLYVPKLIAAILIAKSPEKYGFGDVQYEEEMRFEYAHVPRWTTIDAIACALNDDREKIHLLNAELRKRITPPDQESYQIKVPPNSAETLAQTLPRVRSIVSTKIKYHKVRRHDTISKICRRYHISKLTLLKANNLHKAKLTPGRNLRIPYRQTKYVVISEEELRNGPQGMRNGDFIMHRVKPGESLGVIARHYDVTPQQIASWNHLSNLNWIKAGQKLALYIGHGTPTPGLSSKEEPKVATLKGNNKRAPRPAPSAAAYYRVKGGDSLWKIARRFNVHTEEIKRWNNLKGNTIKPGLLLRLKIDNDA